MTLFKRATDSLTDEEREALFNLAKDKSVIISKADKGNAIVIQDKNEYLSKISELLKSGKKFKKLNKDLTITRD